ncbi:hypothetical protein NPIL_199731 [Nephila pilipes]|uniref:Uncharacterized protein n=1 Tax=Nephila pilipes TaxID=299642 RepID=A0A8X6NSY4_NEPPI|nr:hypothetical protein NPIL_199731 [Nephila pilipes]
MGHQEQVYACLNHRVNPVTSGQVTAQRCWSLRGNQRTTMASVDHDHSKMVPSVKRWGKEKDCFRKNTKTDIFFPLVADIHVYMYTLCFLFVESRQVLTLRSPNY